MLLTAAIDDFLLDRRAKRRSPATLRSYAQVLRRWLATLDVDRTEDLTAGHANRWLLAIREGRSTHTARDYGAVLRAFYSWLASEELVGERVRRRVVVPSAEKRVIRTLNPVQLDHLFAACAFEGDPTLAARDRAILGVLLDTGVRADELCGLLLSETYVRCEEPYLRVFGKGGKEREVGPLGERTTRELRRYLRLRGSGGACPNTFLSRTGRALTPSGLDQLLYRLREWAGPERFAGVRVSAHTFRHTYALAYLRAGGDLLRLSKLLGHSSLRVTETYLRDFEQREARAGGRSVLDGLLGPAVGHLS